MKVAVSSTGDNLDSQVDSRFGRSAYFLIVETDTMNYETIKNENTGLSSGAGIQTASLVASQGITAVLTGNCGPKAAQVLTQGGIEIIPGQSGSVRAVVENYIKGNAVSKTEAFVPEKSGFDRVSPIKGAEASQTIGGGRGMSGGGRGMGGGGGQGMGGGSGRGRGMGGGGGRGMGGGGRGRG
ncbi:MAG: NifB/NifX family molybdenum-iron cluster-binding protein [Deltaproteobacteria bacterium]|nr:NifB/NifX family molybdenum-iron cluster-binding protein [Deltaproteobacteria bacterium]